MALWHTELYVCLLFFLLEGIMESINCLKCRKPFLSSDRKRNRICPKCNEENHKEPKEYHALSPDSRHEQIQQTSTL
jgi:DNA-directed RNA polymerase subunit RPC12/RpoP